jgi:hypothetical protein
MTSIQKETGSFVDLDAVASVAATQFGAVFDLPAVEHTIPVTVAAAN